MDRVSYGDKELLNDSVNKETKIQSLKMEMKERKNYLLWFIYIYIYIIYMCVCVCVCVYVFACVCVCAVCVCDDVSLFTSFIITWKIKF